MNIEPRPPKALAFAAAIAVLTASGGCGPKAKDVEVATGVKGAVDPIALADDCEDRRVVLPELLDDVDHQDSAVRLRLAIALGRIGAVEGAAALSRLAADRDTQVAKAALFSLGLLGARAADERSTLRAAATGDGPLVATALEALGRAGVEEDVSLVFEAGAAAKDQAIVGSALRAIGGFGQREVPVDQAALAWASSLLNDEAEEIRYLAAFVLYRARDAAPPSTVDALAACSLKDASPRVRSYCARALSRRGGMDRVTFEALLGDDDPIVVATAIGATSSTDEAARCELAVIAVDRALEWLSKPGEALVNARVHAVRAALEAASECRDRGFEERAAAILAAVDAATTGPMSGGASRVRCLARSLSGASDLAVVACDPQRPHEGKRALIRRLGRGPRTSAADERVLVRMSEDSDPRVSSAALTALGPIGTTTSREAILGAISRGDALVCAAAIDAIAAFAEAFTEAGDDGARRAIPGVVARIDEAVERFGPVDGLTAPLLSAAAALAALRDPAGAGILAKLAADQRPELRSAALAAYDAIDGPAPPPHLPQTAPTRPVPSKTKAAWRARTARAVIRTSRGPIEIALLSRLAPATVDSFVALAREGFYDGTEIHRVVPGFVVQAGDPSGTGLGDPGYNLRCEVSGARYERGAVGMALSGKDTGGSQFFITLWEQPHLDGAYTLFGRVESGMDVAGLLEEGDTILSVAVTVDDGSGGSGAQAFTGADGTP